MNNIKKDNKTTVAIILNDLFIFVPPKITLHSATITAKNLIIYICYYISKE